MRHRLQPLMTRSRLKRPGLIRRFQAKAEVAGLGNLELVVAKSGHAASQPNGEKAPRLS